MPDQNTIPPSRRSKRPMTLSVTSGSGSPPRAEVLPTIVLFVADSHSLESFLCDELSGLTVFVPGTWLVDVGQQVVLDVGIAENTISFQVRCRVQWKRESSKGDIRRGIGLSLVSPLDLRRLLHGGVKRRGRRYGVSLEAFSTGDGVIRQTRVTDISSTGAHIRTPWEAPLGLHFTLNIRPSWSPPVKASVVCVRSQAGQGMSVSFVDPSPALQDLVSAVADRATSSARVKPLG